MHRYEMFLSIRLLSNLRPTTRERVHLVTRGHLQSRDKDGGRTIRSAVTEKQCCTQTRWLFVLYTMSQKTRHPIVTIIIAKS